MQRRSRHLVTGGLAAALWALPGIEPPLTAQAVPSQGTVRAVVIPMVAGARRPALTADLIYHLLIGPAGGEGRDLQDGLTSYLWTASQGTFRLEAEVLPALAAADDPRGVPARAGRDLDRLLREAVRAAAAGTDLSRFDTDGPDGVPASADDDGQIDFVIVSMEAPVETPDAIWAPTKFKVKTARGDRTVRGVLYVVLPEDGTSPGQVMSMALLAAMGISGESRTVQDGPGAPVGTLALARLGWRETQRVEQSGIYQPQEDVILSVPILDVPDERGRWLLRQVGHETDLIRVFLDRETIRVVERFRVSAEHEEVTIPLTSRMGTRGARMVLTWPNGTATPPEVSIELRQAPARATGP